MKCYGQWENIEHWVCKNCKVGKQECRDLSLELLNDRLPSIEGTVVILEEFDEV